MSKSRKSSKAHVPANLIFENRVPPLLSEKQSLMSLVPLGFLQNRLSELIISKRSGRLWGQLSLYVGCVERSVKWRDMA